MKKQEQEHEFLTVPEVAEILRCSELSILRLLRKGALKGYKPTERRWLVSREDLTRYIQSTRNKKR